MIPELTKTANSKTSLHYIRAAFFFAPLLVLFCCGKNKTNEAPNNNELLANVKIVSGATLNFNVRKEKALMGCSYLTVSYYVTGTDATNGTIAISIPDTTRNCKLGPGMYTSFTCQYRSDITRGQLVYENFPKNGSITFSTLTSSNMEGNFDAVCYYTTADSVIISGTFKADHLTQ